MHRVLRKSESKFVEAFTVRVKTSRVIENKKKMTAIDAVNSFFTRGLSFRSAELCERLDYVSFQYENRLF